MRKNVSISDELLSAYIDRQTNEAELQRVENALAVEPALRERLEALQHTVALLQQAPSLVAPRAFVLSEQQVLAAGGRIQGTKQLSFWEQWLPRLTPVVTAFIAVLFVLSLTSNFQQQTQSSVPSPSLAAEEPQMEAPAEIEAQSMAAEAPQATEMKTAEQPTAMVMAPQARSRSAEGGKPVTATASTDAAVAEVQGVTEMTEAAPAGGAVAEEPPSAPEQVQPTPAPASPTLFSTASPVTWLLGILLIIFLFLTWRFTFARSSEQ